ncbi:MAG TPA: hypothetical protein VG347_20755, partial [Verrucomicrobiae bacterium]|nr:hypothetical protein [Verrucomicrobiae bacterium]
ETQGAIADKTAAWLAARYLVEAQKLNAGESKADWNRLRELCHDVVALRRAGHQAQRLVLADGHHEIRRSGGTLI